MYYKKDTSAKTFAMCIAHVSAARVHAIEECAREERERADAQNIAEYCRAQMNYKRMSEHVEKYDEIIDLIDASEFEDFGDLARAVADVKGFPGLVLQNLKNLVEGKEF